MKKSLFFAICFFITILMLSCSDSYNSSPVAPQPEKEAKVQKQTPAQKDDYKIVSPNLVKEEETMIMACDSNTKPQ